MVLWLGIGLAAIVLLTPKRGTAAAWQLAQPLTADQPQVSVLDSQHFGGALTQTPCTTNAGSLLCRWAGGQVFLDQGPIYVPAAGNIPAPGPGEIMAL